MKASYFKQLACVAALAATGSVPVCAQLFITEVSPWSSTSSTYLSDWFELTNTGGSAIDVTGWKVDDNSNSFASSVPLSGITSIGAGKSVIFIDLAGSDLATKSAAFVSAWFGVTPPASLEIGGYGGTSIGLSTGGDAVNIYNSLGTLQANVVFGANTAGPVFRTFDNTAGLNGTTISTLSTVGVNGAFASTDVTFSAAGSPGVTPVPEPSEYAAAFGLLSLGLAVWIRRQQR